MTFDNYLCGISGHGCRCRPLISCVVHLNGALSPTVIFRLNGKFPLHNKLKGVCVCACAWRVTRGDIWHFINTSEASPSLSFQYVYVVHDRHLSGRFGPKSAPRKNGHIMEDIALFQPPDMQQPEIAGKLIGAVKQLVIFVLADSLINCRRGHLDHLSCLGEPRFITVRGARHGQRERPPPPSNPALLAGTNGFAMLMLPWYKRKRQRAAKIQSSMDSSGNGGVLGRSLT